MSRSVDSVAAQEPLGVLEAMKMELTLVAPFAGTVTQVGAAPGSRLPIGHLVFRVEPVEPVRPAATVETAATAAGAG